VNIRTNEYLSKPNEFLKLRIEIGSVILSKNIGVK